ISRLRGRKCYIFIGGYDAACYPELGYGVFCSPFRAFCARMALKTCTHVIANHRALLSSENAYYDPSGHPEGIYKLIPNLATPASVIFNAVASPPPSDLGQPRKKQILTVGTTPRLRDFYNKGFDLLTQVAGRRPDLRFVFVGIREQWLAELDRLFRLRELSNIRLASHLAHGQLLGLMKESAVYAQPSISEGMPNALMEAMLMGCVPVGSDVAGIPTVIGEFGFVFSRRGPKLLEDALDKALACDADRKAISAGIRERFSFEARKDKLLSLLNA
ncbi:MAG: glycosyltransferase family 4 protein, partial [Candidatus Syntrophosphaera sp.]